MTSDPVPRPQKNEKQQKKDEKDQAWWDAEGKREKAADDEFRLGPKFEAQVPEPEPEPRPKRVPRPQQRPRPHE